MKWCLRSAFVFFVTVAWTVPTAAYAQSAAAPPPATPRTAADGQLKALYDEYARWDAKESGTFEDARGESKPADYLPRADEASQLRRAADLRRFLDRLKAIPAPQLSPEERVNAAVLRTILENGIEEAR